MALSFEKKIRQRGQRIYRNKMFYSNRTFLHGVVLCFLIGFFAGALFYYFFRQSFENLIVYVQDNIVRYKNSGKSVWLNVVRVLWSHGKYFIFFWIFMVNPTAEKFYQILFILYTGVRNGFLLLFFVMSQGVRGFFLYGASMFPHIFLFLPLYLFCFFWTQKNRHRRNELWVPVLIGIIFLSACFIEVKFNLPLMERLLT